MSHPSSHAGFTLVEALIAALVLCSAVGGLAHLVAVGTRQAATARRSATASQLAQSRLEDLRGLAWSFDEAGGRVSSADLAVAPDDALERDTPGYVDGVDEFGANVTLDHDSRAYLRRWRVSWIGGEGSDLLLLQVCVFASGIGARVQQRAPDACVSAIRGRQP